MNEPELVAALEDALGGHLDAAAVEAMRERAVARGLAEAEEAMSRLVRRRALAAALAQLGPATGVPARADEAASPTDDRAAPGRAAGSPGARVLLAHAVVEGVAEPEDGDLVAITTDAGDLSLLASWVDRDLLDEERWDPRSPDRATIEPLVTRHDAIVREACATHRAVPLRLGGIFDDASSAGSWLDRRSTELRATIELVGDCAEWTVRVANEADADALASLASHAVLHLPSGPDRLDATYLVPTDLEPSFLDAIDGLEEDDLIRDVSGPWPPYTFADTQTLAREVG